VSFKAGLEAMARAGVPFEFRKGISSVEEAPDVGEVDLWLAPEDLGAAGAALVSVGFVSVESPAQGPHRYFVEMRDGSWRKLDVKLRGAREVRGIERLAVARRPLAARRSGPVIAIVGPDGSGKGTVIDALARAIPVAVTRVYLGAARESPPSPMGSFDAAPTRQDPPEPPAPPGLSARELAFVLRKSARAWWRLLRAYGAAWRGHIVLIDRHPLEVLAVRPFRSASGAAFERFLAVRLTPRPDALVVLHALPEVLFERKPEHPVETYRRWRVGYEDAFRGLGATFVHTGDPLEQTLARVSEVVWQALRARRAQ